MRRRSLSVAAFILAAACGVADNPTITEPAIQRPLVASPVVVQSCAVTFTQLQNQLLALFADGSNDETSALSKLNNIQHQLDIGAIATAQAKAWDLVTFIQSKKTKNTFLGDAQEIAAFTNALFCFVGYGPNSFLIFPSDLAQTITTNDGLAGVQIPANNVAVPTLLTINPLASAPPLVTLLDIHPLYYDFAITNEAGAGAWLADVVVGVCATADASVLPYLLLGHQSGTTFELLPSAPVGFLDCSGAGGSGNVAMNVTGDSLVAAAVVIGSSGVGGSTDDFSPIAPVDSRVVGSSGAGGGADDFRPRRGMTPSMNLVSLPSVVCSLPITALIGTQVADACRPTVTFATPTQHTPIPGVNVSWIVESGGGSISAPPSCSPFVNPLSTDANGVTTVCWQLGAIPGTNTVTATAIPGGQVPNGVVFVYSEGGAPEPDAIKIRFTAEGIKLNSTTTITCNPTSVQYNGQPQTPCTAVATDGTGWSTPVTVTYTNNTNAGTANASATFAEDATHYGSGDTETFQITQRSATATAGNGTMQFGGVVPPISCAVAGLVAGDAGAITCTASVTGTPQVPGVATVPTISYNTATAQNNYAVNSVNGFLTVQGYVQVGCFASPVFSVMPTTKSAQNKGSNLPVKCTLKWPNGTAVSNATGSLQLWDLGTGAVDGSTPQPGGAPGLTIAGAFAPTSNGNYSHQLNTNPTFYVAGRAYYIKALWIDGSTTTGYFRIK